MYKHYLLLLLTAAIWGFAFVAQRLGSQHLDPFVFNGLRFALGAVFVGILAHFSGKRLKLGKDGLILGVVLFAASFLQQLGLFWTSAGAAGFITGLYVVFVPLIGIYRKQKLSLNIALALPVSFVGLSLMNDFSSLEISLGNLLVLAGAVFWALHVQLIDKYMRTHSTLSLAANQYSVASMLSLVFAIVWISTWGSADDIIARIARAQVPILYGGIFSVGIAFSLQAFAQKKVKPAPAAILLCSEGIFAMLSGYLILAEPITLRIVIGAILMLAAMLVVLLEGRFSPIGKQSKPQPSI